MAQPPRRKQRYYPPIQPKPPYRRTNHFNDFPQTKETTTPEHKTNPPQQIRNNKWSNGDHIAFWGVLVNVALAVATYLLYMLSKDAAYSAKISAEAAKKSADLQSIAWDSTKLAKRKSDIADAAKLGRDTLFINKQKAGIDSQIASLNQIQKNFIKENEPNLQVGTFGNLTVVDGLPISFDYKLYNMGKFVVKGLRYGVAIRFFSEPDSAVYIKNPFFRLKDTLKFKEYITQEQFAPIKTYFAPTALPTGYSSAFTNGECTFYFIGKYYYYNSINKKNRLYRFIYQMVYNKFAKRVSYTPIINDNIDIK